MRKLIAQNWLNLLRGARGLLFPTRTTHYMFVRYDLHAYIKTFHERSIQIMSRWTRDPLLAVSADSISSDDNSTATSQVGSTKIEMQGEAVGAGAGMQRSRLLIRL